MKPELSFIIINWNGGNLLRSCLESIVNFPPAIPHEILVVDNASTDGSLEWLQSEAANALCRHVSLRVIENKINAGFGKANNQAFAATETSLLFLLNCDAELQSGTSDRLVETLRSNSRIGACGPRIINPDGSLQISVWRNPPTAWATLLSGLRLYSLLPRRLSGELLLAEHWEHHRRRDVPMLSGAALLLKREVVSEVGGFDERFHMYGEDNEWCLRITRAGWRLVFEPKAVVVHHGGHGALRRWTDLEKLRVQTESYLLFLDRSLSRHQIAGNLAASVSLLALQSTWRKLRKRSASDVDLVLRLYLEKLKRILCRRASESA